MALVVAASMTLKRIKTNGKSFGFCVQHTKPVMMLTVVRDTFFNADL